MSRSESSSMSDGAHTEPRANRLGELLRRERALSALLVMAVAGLAISVYLTTVHYTGLPLVCPANTLINCAQVTSSPYSVVPGTQLPITIPGLLWFLVSGGIAYLALARSATNRPEPARLRLFHLLWGAAGLFFVLYLVYCEIVLLHRLCEWCTVVHLLTLATFLVALSRWQQGPAPLYAPRRTDAPRRERPVSSPGTRTAPPPAHGAATVTRVRRTAPTATKARAKRR